MALIRRLTPANRRLLLALFACAMLVRALVPAGWMPSPDGGLMLCDGMTPAAQTATGSPHAGHAMRHHSSRNPPSPAQPQSGDHPCAFAGPVAAVEAPQPTFVLPPAAPRHQPPATRFLVAVGQGLAAPPPPQTGPPAFA